MEAEAEGWGPKTLGGPDNNGELSPKQRLQGENGELSHKNGMIDDYKTYSGDTVELDTNNNMIWNARRDQ